MDYIKQVVEATKKTPVILIVPQVVLDSCEFITLVGENFTVFIGECDELKVWLSDHGLSYIYEFCDRRNSKLDLLPISNINARIEPGAIIREGAVIGEYAVILMGAVINVGAKIGEYTMVDMNAVIGSGAQIGIGCHIGAGAVISGMMEPACQVPVVIKNHVLIGANATILEGVTVHEHAVVAAGSVVLTDVEKNTIVGGVPAKFIKYRSETKSEKIDVIDALRTL